MTILAVIATIAAWILGMVLDAELHFGIGEAGWLELRIFLPILVMGGFIVYMLNKNKD